MFRFTLRAALAASLFATTACTQEAAMVDLKGQSSFSRNATSAQSSYASNSISSGSSSGSYVTGGSSSYTPPPVYSNVSQTTSQNASVQSIGISDLPPPSSSTPVAKHADAAPAPVSGVNHWTGKSRVSDTGESHSEITTSKDTFVAQADDMASKTGLTATKVSTASASSQKYIWPVSGKKVISGFGPKGAGKANDGINIAAANGEPVWAAADGEVLYVGNELAGYGNMVLIRHGGNKSTSYAHLSRVTVDKYDRVKQGDIIGYVGTTGDVKTSQLYFGVRNGKDPVDPKKYLGTGTKVAGI